MAKKKYEEANIQSIADAIREKTGTDDTYKTSEMASGVNEVYEAGKQTAYDEFWDAFQQNGKRGNYNYGFAGEGWNDETFKPKYDIVPTANPGNTFYMCKITDLETALSSSGIIMDFSKGSNFPQTFYMAGFTVIPEIDFSGATNTANPFLQTFMRCADLVTIRKIKLPTNGTQTFSATFSGCNSLQDIEFEGVIGQTISLANSPLTVESIKNIISCLKNYAGTTSEFAYTLTLSSASKTLLEAEGATSPNGNTWSQYVDDLGWKLA